MNNFILFNSFLLHSDRPIAIAYSPTEPNPTHLAEIYRPTPAHHSNTPIYVNAVPDISESVNQQFQAPFFPSINLENTQSTHNGWSVVTPSTFIDNLHLNSNQPQQQQLQQQQLSEPKTNSNSNNLISASLLNINGTVNQSENESSSKIPSSIEESTKKFDIESFKPDFLGGFKPIIKSSAERSESKSVELNPIPSSVSVENKSSDEISLESIGYDDEEDIL